MLKIAYIPGPGDIAGTYEYWKRGVDDPRIPAKAYSAMFFDICRDLGANFRVIQRASSETGRRAPLVDGQASIVFETMRPYSGPVSYWKSKAIFSRLSAGRVNDFDPDIVLVGGDFFWPMLPLLKWKRKRKLILSIHNTYWPMQTAPRLHAKIGNAALGALFRANIDAAIAVSRECANQFRSITGQIPVFVGGPKILNASIPVNEEPEPRTVGFLGRTETSKGVYDLLEAFETAAASIKDIRLSFAGDGSELDRLRSRINSSPFRERITCCGRLDAIGVYQFLQSIAVLACPTRKDFREGFADVCAEALAHGVPSIVSTTVPAVELLGGAAFVFESEDRSALTKALLAVFGEDGTLDKLKKNALASRHHLSDETLSWEHAIKRAIYTVGGADL